MPADLTDLEAALSAASDPSRAAILARYFKTRPGEYGEGDQFIGIRVPQLRKMAKQYAKLPRKLLATLITSPIHEKRVLAIFILIKQYQAADGKEQADIIAFYTQHLDFINNWDLVDLSAHALLGNYLYTRSHQPLYDLAASPNLWKRRISMVATYSFIRQGHYETTLNLATRFLHDTHDLIHKATGWMLREAGKQDRSVLIAFLDMHADKMPRTMLRYALEKIDEPLRKHYMSLKRTAPPKT